MTFSSASSPSALEWKLSQVFGEPSSGEEVEDIDIISAIEFERSGDYLAVGDRGGRVVIFQRKAGKDKIRDSRNELEQLDFVVREHPEFQYKTEFQSHEPEFDYLKSVEIEEKINKVRWCPSPNGSLFVLSTNDKTIKLWKIANNGDAAPARCRKLYAHAHDFNINSISNNSDGEIFVSADDLRINLWNLEVSDQCFNIIDMKPSNMEDLTEVITSAEFHPHQCNILGYSSSRGFIRLVDMRQSALCDHSARILQDVESRGVKSFFTEIIASISDMKFATDGRHILTRDYMNLKLWDMHMETSPVATYKIHEHLRPKLCELYNNDNIFDKFDCCLSEGGVQFATGSYSNVVRIFPFGVGSEEGLTVEARRNPNRKPHLQTATRSRRSSLSNLTRGFYRQGSENSNSAYDNFSYDLNSKLLHLAWHPATNSIACASGNTLFMYCA